MITNLIILKICYWVVWTIVIIAATLWLSSINRRKRIKADLIRQQNNEKMNEKELERGEKLERGYYYLGGSVYEERTFFSTLSNRIKVTWQIHEKATNDLLTISSSWPIDISENDLKNFQELLPELISIKAINKHQLSFKKSPAAEFDHIKEVVLKNIFNHLNKKYAWLGKETTVLLEAYKCDPREDYMLCKLEHKLSEHLALGAMLGNVEGIKNKDSIMTQMRCDTNTFNIIKEAEKSWDELIPSIKAAFVNYFPEGVEFTGDYPSVEKKL
jgi:hypothetical protein